MRKLILAALIAASSFSAQAIDINISGVRVTAPGVNVTFGSRDNRGYYWDGREYRDPDYWKRHNGHRGENHYTGHGKGRGHDHDDHDRDGGRHCPPGQAKKGNC